MYLQEDILSTKPLNPTTIFYWLLTTAVPKLSSTDLHDSTPSSLLTQDSTKHQKAITSPQPLSWPTNLSITNQQRLADAGHEQLHC